MLYTFNLGGKDFRFSGRNERYRNEDSGELRYISGLAPDPAGVPDPAYPVYTGEKSTENSRFYTGENPVKIGIFDFIPVNFRPG